jgi:tetratricopeptide (TPR) repeat protein
MELQPDPNWDKSPVHMFLLGSFLEPKRLEELTPALDWEFALGEEPEAVVELFMAAGLLQYADRDLPLPERMEQFRTTDLREMLRERNLPVSGRKAELIDRLVEIDAMGMEEATRQISALQCTTAGKLDVENFLLGASAIPLGTDEKVVPGVDWEQPASGEGREEPATEVGEGRSGPLAWLTERIRGDGSEPTEEAKDITFKPTDAALRRTEEHIRRGLSYGNQGDFVQALLEFDQAVRFNPQDAHAHFWRGVTLERLGDYRQALAEFDQATALDPEQARFFVGLGDAYRGLQEWRKAIAQYDMAIERDPKATIAHHNRGIAYERVGDYQQALYSYNKAVELDPNSPEPYYGRGVAYEQWGAYARAATEYKIVLELSDNPDIQRSARERLDHVQPLA